MYEADISFKSFIRKNKLSARYSEVIELYKEFCLIKCMDDDYDSFIYFIDILNIFVIPCCCDNAKPIKHNKYVHEFKVSSNNEVFQKYIHPEDLISNTNITKAYLSLITYIFDLISHVDTTAIIKAYIDKLKNFQSLHL